MPRRGVNIYKRKDGRWEGRIQKGKLGGRRRYQSVYGATYAEAKMKMEALKADGPAKGPGGRCTLGEAAGIWLKERSPHWKRTTYATYHNIVRK